MWIEGDKTGVNFLVNEGRRRREGRGQESNDKADLGWEGWKLSSHCKLRVNGPATGFPIDMGEVADTLTAATRASIFPPTSP